MERSTILTGDYHTHTVFSHGKGTIEENALAAREIGLKELGISDHGFSHPAFGITEKKMRRMREEIDRLNGVYPDLKILLGIESNLLGESGAVDLKEENYGYFDLFLVGFHKFIMYEKFGDWFTFFGKNFFCSKLKKRPSEKLVKLNTKAYVNAIKKYPVDAITHINYCVFADAVEVAKAAADYGTYIELNSKKTHLKDDELVKVAQTGVRFIISSDAHSTDRIGDTALVDELLARTGIDRRLIDNIDGRTPDFRFARFKRGSGI